MKMEFHANLLEQIQSVAEYEIGETVYINVQDGESGTVFAYIIYDTHIEYLVRTKEQGIIQLDRVSLSETKRIV